MSENCQALIILLLNIVRKRIKVIFIQTHIKYKIKIVTKNVKLIVINKTFRTITIRLMVQQNTYT